MHTQFTVVQSNEQPDGTTCLLIEFTGVVHFLQHTFCFLELTIQPNMTCIVKPVTPDGVVQPDQIIGTGLHPVKALEMFNNFIVGLPRTLDQTTYYAPTGRVEFHQDSCFCIVEYPVCTMCFPLPYKKTNLITNEQIYQHLLFEPSEEPFYRRPYSSN